MTKSSGDSQNGSAGAEEACVGGVKLTHPDRIVFAAQGATKLDIAEYMRDVASRIMPYLKNHPVSLVRCPSGMDGTCFYQKHHADSMPAAIGKTRIQEKDGDWADYIVLNSAEALISAAQIGALELHVWGAKTDRLDRPDRLVFDLDPDASVDFGAVKIAAREIQNILARANLQSFPLLTGGKGIHVVSPLERRADWETLKAAAKAVAEYMARGSPDRYVSVASKAERKGKIYIDWLRNERGATAVCPYSLRARPGAPVATPLAWMELAYIDSAARYNLSNIRQRLGKLSADPWEGYANLRQSLSQRTLNALLSD